MKVYFAIPHSPWEHGANKNTNDLLQNFFPKDCNMIKVTAKEVAMAQALLNNRPIKCINYRTSAEALNKLPSVAIRN